MEMKTGTIELNELQPDRYAFILSFLAVIWRRVWITAQIYSWHNFVDLDDGIVLKCLKYNILAPTGIGNTIKEYLTKALKTGFLMPKDYEKNIYAQRAIKLYSQAYKIASSKDRDSEIKFIHDYASSVFDLKSDLNNNNECIDTIKDIDKEKTIEEITILNILGDKNHNHNCKLCNQIEIWNIDLGLMHSEDPYQNVIMYGLLAALESKP